MQFVINIILVRNSLHCNFFLAIKNEYGDIVNCHNFSYSSFSKEMIQCIPGRGQVHKMLLIVLVQLC